VSERGGLRQFLESRVMWVLTPTIHFFAQIRITLVTYLLLYRYYYHFNLLYLSICAMVT
jgi:hypothetical protein